MRTRIALAAATIVAVTLLVAGCTSEDDVLDTWRNELGHPKAVTSIDQLDCREPLPTSYEHCALTVHVRDDITRQQVVDLIDTYLAAGRKVYATKDFDQRIGTLVLRRGSSSYGFVPMPYNSPLRRTPADAPLDFWLKHGAPGWDISDADGSRATLELDWTSPADLVKRATELAPTLQGIDNAVISADAPKGDASNLTHVSLVIKHGVVPMAEWRLARAAAGLERDQPFTASVSQGDVHLVAQLRGSGTNDPAVAKRAEVLADRMESRAPKSIHVTVGYRVVR